MNPRHIVIDGKVYHSVDEMPPEVRARYERAAASLPADMPQMPQPAPSTSMMTGGMTFVVDGKEYHRIEDLPPEARAKYEQAMGMLDRNRNGMPDILEGMLGAPPQTTVSTGTAPSSAPQPASRPPMPAPPAIAPDTSNGWLLLLLGGFLAILCLLAAAGVWYFFWR